MNQQNEAGKNRQNQSQQGFQASSQQSEENRRKGAQDAELSQKSTSSHDVDSERRSMDPAEGRRMGVGSDTKRDQQNLSDRQQSERSSGQQGEWSQRGQQSSEDREQSQRT